MKAKTFMLSVAMAVLGSCVIPFILVQYPEIIEKTDRDNVVAPTNVVQSTNMPWKTSSQTNINWFLDGSRFIWDDWKLK